MHELHAAYFKRHFATLRHRPKISELVHQEQTGEGIRGEVDQGARPPATSSQAASFPPLGPSTPTPHQDHKVILQNLASLTVCVPYHLPIAARQVLMSLAQKGTTVTLITKTSKRYEGVVVSTESER